MTVTPFHLAFPVRDLDETCAFYCGVLGCREGRRAEKWVNFDFYGHQLSAHLAPENPSAVSRIDGTEVTILHFGVILGWDQFHQLAQRLQSGGIAFLAEPAVQFPGQTGEQACSTGTQGARHWN